MDRPLPSVTFAFFPPRGSFTIFHFSRTKPIPQPSYLESLLLLTDEVRLITFSDFAVLAKAFLPNGRASSC